jgi:molybdenum cofactor cytidylyltransferase
MKIAAIVLAAGRSSRFEGGNKLLAEFEGRPLIHHVMTAVAASPVDEIILVTAAFGGKIFAAACQFDDCERRWRTVVNPDAEDGLSSSIQYGLSHLESGIDGALIMLADMPRVSTSMIERLCEAFITSKGAAIVFPQSADGQQGNPVLWPRALFAELMALTGDIGGRAILTRHQALHHAVAVDSGAAFYDVDTAADLRS